MEVQDYISVFTQAPLAVILIAYIYFSDRQRNKFIEKNFHLYNDIIIKITNSLNEAIKIIKQQERK